MAGSPGPVTMGGQARGQEPVRCAPVVVALVGSRGHGSLKGDAALPLMVYIHGAGEVVMTAG
ncbi:MAG: hypothetical protein Q7O12_10840 [Deltaproteobacteria bacterium]|nr:hypothetical protein [Deltaproteobacteria bacterium]